VSLEFAAAVAATKATVLEPKSAPPTVNAVTDTRTLRAGDTFVALRGERHDGHAFAADAVQRGAAALVVDEASAAVPGVATLVVGNTLRAYMDLAALARESFRGTVVGITGSTGKTTTRSFLEQLARARYGDRVLAPPGNENNEIGVSKVLLEADDRQYDVIVLELGARHFGDVAVLVDIARPQIGVLTNIGEAHLEIMGSRERLADTKWGLFSRGARAVLNADDGVSRGRAGSLDIPAHWFAAGNDAAQWATLQRLTAVAGDTLIDRDGAQAVRRDVNIDFPGPYNRWNLAAAAAAALELGIPLDVIAFAVETLQLPAGRYARMTLRDGGPKIIYDAYNANASGMIAALDAFAQESAGRRIAVLASMAELGEESQALHERVGAHAARVVDVLVVEGDFASELARGARDAGLQPSQIVEVRDNTEAAQWLRDHATARDAVLLKGSRKYRLEEIVEALL
jgi:UDP-N-acetylmuramoyl-tripeptide--D-alanyl-D-alanine ligase